MRWFVEVGPLGGAAESKSVIEASSWQSALAIVRTARGDAAPLTAFEIEVIADGGRVTNSEAKQRYTVHKAPDDAPLSNGNGATRSPSAAPPPSKPNPASIAFAAMSRKPSRAVAAKGDLLTPPPASSPVSGSETRRSSRPPPPARPASQPPPRPSASLPAVAAISASEHGSVFHRRAEDPSGASPLTVREVAVALSGASRDRAVAAARAHLAAIVRELDEAKVPAGRLVHLAVFDVPWAGRPTKPPIAALVWKDWQSEPEIKFPGASGTMARVEAPIAAHDEAPSRSTQPMAPPEPEPPRAIEAPVPATATPSRPRMHAQTQSFETPMPAAVAPHAHPRPAQTHAFEVPVTPPPPSTSASRPRMPAQTQSFEQIPAPSPPSAPPPRSQGRMPTQTVSFEAIAEPTPPPAAAPSAPRVLPSDAGEVAQEISSAVEAARAAPAAESFVNPLESLGRGSSISYDPFAPVSAPSPSAPIDSAPRSSRPDDLTSEIFESLHDLHFLHDSLDGADFVLELLAAKIPTRLAMVHLYDINAKEFVVVRTRPDNSPVVGARTREGSGLIGEAVKRGKPILIQDAHNDPRWMRERYAAAGYTPSVILVAPIRHGQRYVGAIEVADHVDGEGFGESEINALAYIGEQFGEFVEQHGITIDRNRADQSGGYFSLGIDTRRR